MQRNHVHKYVVMAVVKAELSWHVARTTEALVGTTGTGAQLMASAPAQPTQC